MRQTLYYLRNEEDTDKIPLLVFEILLLAIHTIYTNNFFQIYSLFPFPATFTYHLYVSDIKSTIHYAVYPLLNVPNVKTTPNVDCRERSGSCERHGYMSRMVLFPFINDTRMKQISAVRGHILKASLNYSRRLFSTTMAPLKKRAVAGSFILKFPNNDVTKYPQVALFMRSDAVRTYK